MRVGWSGNGRRWVIVDVRFRFVDVRIMILRPRRLRLIKAGSGMLVNRLRDLRLRTTSVRRFNSEGAMSN